MVDETIGGALHCWGAGLHLMPMLAMAEARPLGVADESAELALAACQSNLKAGLQEEEQQHLVQQR